MKLGAENKKKVYALAVLGVVAAYMVYSQLLSGPSYTPAPAPAATAGDSAAASPATAPAAPEKSSGPDISRAGTPAARSGTASKNSEFHPVLRSKKPEERPDVSKIDPTLRLDLMFKVMDVPPAGADRDLFQILTAPPVKVTELAKKDEPKVPRFVGPRPPPPPRPDPPPPPPPPPEPIPLKFYGFSTLRPDGKRTAYFLDGDDILEAVEGTTLKGRYRIVQIGLDKVLVEDTQAKRRQSVSLEPEAKG
jgi:hypothetical protein